MQSRLFGLGGRWAHVCTLTPAKHSSVLKCCLTFMGGTSTGEGRYAQTVSSSGCTPLFLKALPHVTGTKTLPMVPLRISLVTVAMSGSSPCSRGGGGGGLGGVEMQQDA